MAKSMTTYSGCHDRVLLKKDLPQQDENFERRVRTASILLGGKAPTLTFSIVPLIYHNISQYVLHRHAALATENFPRRGLSSAKCLDVQPRGFQMQLPA